MSLLLELDRFLCEFSGALSEFERIFIDVLYKYSSRQPVIIAIVGQECLCSWGVKYIECERRSCLL